MVALAGKVKEQYERMTFNNLLWFWRAQSSRMGMGAWSDTPVELQDHIRVEVKARAKDMNWLVPLVRFHMCYKRTWSPEAMCRIVLFDLVYSVLLEVIYSMEKTEDGAQ